MRKICVITGSRAEYGLLSGLMAAIKNDIDLQLQIIATNMHLSPEFGYTYKEIAQDGFVIDKKVEMLLSSDTANGTTKSVGLATIGFADAYEDLKPDLLLVLGDRYEMLAAVTAALFYKIPVAHLHGGEITEGAYDDAIRHSITKMSHLHFTSTEEYRNRVIQMGEDPRFVYNVGALGVENSQKIKLLDKTDLENSIGIALGNKSLLVTFHPTTLDTTSSFEQCESLLKVLDLYLDYTILFTLPNSDSDGRIIRDLIFEFVDKHKNHAVAFHSLGVVRYLSTLQFVTAVIGNSSSGIIEAPTFGKPTLDIGNRQKGRLSADSVVHCECNETSIKNGLELILSSNFLSKAKVAKNPYFKENTCQEIFSIIKSMPLEGLIEKSFYTPKLKG